MSWWGGGDVHWRSAARAQRARTAGVPQTNPCGSIAGRRFGEDPMASDRVVLHLKHAQPKHVHLVPPATRTLSWIEASPTRIVCTLDSECCRFCFLSAGPIGMVGAAGLTRSSLAMWAGDLGL